MPDERKPTDVLRDGTFAMINELMRVSEPVGIMAMGASLAACVKEEIEPTREFLEVVSKFESFDDALDYIDAWVAKTVWDARMARLNGWR